jgi:HD-like signal output (HDOD) protein
MRPSQPIDRGVDSTRLIREQTGKMKDVEVLGRSGASGSVQILRLRQPAGPMVGDGVRQDGLKFRWLHVLRELFRSGRTRASLVEMGLNPHLVPPISGSARCITTTTGFQTSRVHSSFMSHEAILQTLSDKEIRRRIDACPKLGSLQSINKLLGELLRSNTSLNSQIADVIRRDPSLSVRLLRVINSVYLGLSTRTNSIEEAVFYLGVRQIHELSMATPILEELEKLQRSNPNLPWQALWRHSIATAAVTREILRPSYANSDDDTSYLVGLLHNIGKVVMAYAFPDELRTIMTMSARDPDAACAFERAIIGWDHAQIGAYFLSRHNLSEEICFAVQFHNQPERAPRHQTFAAAVQVADHLVRHQGIEGAFEKVGPIEKNSWVNLRGWEILFGAEKGAAGDAARTSLASAMRQFAITAQGLL